MTNSSDFKGTKGFSDYYVFRKKVGNTKVLETPGISMLWAIGMNRLN